MNKLDMAHDYAKIILERMLVGDTDTLSYSEIASDAYQLADAMQAEADRREQEQATKNAESSKQMMYALTNERPNAEPNVSITNTNLNWQPDWNVAPDWAKYWFKDEESIYWWSKLKPYFLNQSVSKIVINNTNNTAPSFNYQGDWKQSLRKRPQ